MVGITSYGAYIPRYRIRRKDIYSAIGWLNPASLLPGEKAVASYDEDSITMAVAACMDCLTGIGRNEIDGLYFASTTMPYKERLNSEIIATALNLRPDIKAADFSGSTKAGTTALISALDAVKAGSAKNVLVCASDCRLGKPGGYIEEMYGDAAAVILVSSEDSIADLLDSHSVSYDFVDHWRADGDRFNRGWEDRWIRDEGYARFIGEAISGLIKKSGLSPNEVARVAYSCLYERAYTIIGKKTGFEAAQLLDPLFDQIGYVGTSYPLVLLVAMLEGAGADEKLIVASYGNGSDAILLQTTERVGELKGKRKGVKENLESKRRLKSYEKYIAFKNIIPVDTGGRGEEVAGTAISTLWRERKSILGLTGSKCKRCSTPQYPPQLICVNPDCQAVGEMEDYAFSDKQGKVFSFTEDNLAFSVSPPAIYGIVDFDGGGRFLFDVTDCDSGELKVDMPVEMSFRRKYLDEGRGFSGYFWKATPIMTTKEG